MSYTILRPSYFMEVWLGPHLGFDFRNRKATVYGAGEQRISFISLGDVAEFAVRAVRTRHAESSTIELGGPNAVSPLEAVRIFEELGGAPFEVQHVWHEDRGFRKMRILNATVPQVRSDYVVLLEGDCIPNPDYVGVHLRWRRPGTFLYGHRVFLDARITRGDDEVLEGWGFDLRLTF